MQYLLGTRRQVGESAQDSFGVLVALLLFLLVIALWLPFGIRTPGYHEPWATAAAYDAGRPLLLTPLQPRIYMEATWGIAYHLTPDSFTGFHLLMILGFWAKGITLYAILRRLLPASAPFAFAVAVLFVIYPADTGLFYMKAAQHHLALALYLVAVYLLIRFWQRPTIFYMIGIWLALLVSNGIYETGLPLIAATPLILLWLERRITFKLILVSLAWYAIPFYWAIQILALLLSPAGSSGYIGFITQTGMESSNLVYEMIRSLIHMYGRHYITSWIHSFSQLISIPIVKLLAISGIVLVTMFVAIQYLFRVNLVEGKTSYQFTGFKIQLQRQLQLQTYDFAKNRKIYLGLFVIGFVMIGLGFAMYLPTGLRNETIRTYFYTALGASISITALCFWISSFLPRPHIVFAALIALLSGAAMMNSLNQHQDVVTGSLRQQSLLGGVIEQVPYAEPGSFFLIVTESVNDLLALNFENVYLSNAFAYLYQDYSTLNLDEHWPGNSVKACLYNPIDIPSDWMECLPRAEGVGVRDNLFASGERLIPYNNIIALSLSSSGDVKLLNELPEPFAQNSSSSEYDVSALINQNSNPPYRVYTVFNHWPTGTRTFSDSAGINGLAIVTIDSSLTGRLQVDEHLITAPWGIESIPTDSFYWLGEDVEQGFGFGVQSQSEQSISIQFDVASGPAREDLERTVELIIEYPNAHITREIQTFNTDARLTFVTSLPQGYTKFRLAVLDEATVVPSGDTRPLLVLLHHVNITSNSEISLTD